MRRSEFIGHHRSPIVHGMLCETQTERMRRFTFVELMPDSSLVPVEVAGVPLRQVFERLNERIVALLDRDHQIGHSYFMDVNTLDDLRFAWYHRVVPLLQEYFYNDGERLRAALGDGFVEKVKVEEHTRKALGDLYDDSTPKYEVIKELDGDAFVEALNKILDCCDLALGVRRAH